MNFKVLWYSHNHSPRLGPHRLIYGRPVSLRVCRSSAKPQMPRFPSLSLRAPAAFVEKKRAALPGFGAYGRIGNLFHA